MIVFLVWFTGYNIASQHTSSDILDGMTWVAIVTLYAALGVYSHVSFVLNYTSVFMNKQANSLEVYHLLHRGKRCFFPGFNRKTENPASSS